MIGSLTFTRDDGTTFTFSAVNPPYQLTPDTQLPAGLTLDVSGGEYTGRNGGYTLAGRLQRRTARIVYNVRETSSDARSMMQLLNDAAEFFRPMTADLRIVSFTMLVQTDDSSQSAYLMRRGHVTTPFMAPLLRGGHGSYAAEFDLIFDDPLLYWADGSGVVSGDILPAALPGSKIGEVWQEGLQVWSAGLSRWEYPDQGGGGTPQTVHVVSAYQVPVAFKITGQITNPKIVNSRNGSQWSWEGTIPYGRVVSVDVDGVATDWQGNRLLNTMGGLVAAPGDNTFTLTGSDLALDLKAAWSNITYAWTGTSNASTSTMSQDGRVVATNLANSPKPLASGWAQFNANVTDTPEGLAVSSQKANADAYVKSDIPCNPDTTYHIIADLAQLDGPTHSNGPLCVVEWITANVNAAAVHTEIGGVRQGILQADITTAHDATSITIRLYAPLDTTQQIVWRHIGLYTAADWSAMQALGVTWFDGDSGSTRISTLSQDGSVVAMNRVTSPKPLASGWRQADANVTDTPEGLAVSSQKANADAYVDSTVPCSPDTTYHIIADLAQLDGPTHSNGPLFIFESVDAYGALGALATHPNIGGDGRGVLQADFTTAPTANYLHIRLYAPLDVTQQIVWRHIGLYTAADWSAMQALGVTWFSGDSTFNVVTAKASVNIRGAF